MKAKERLIFDNYDPERNYPNEDVIEDLEANNMEITDENIRNMRDWLMQEEFSYEYNNIKFHFKDKKVVMSGGIQRWDGTSRGVSVFDSFEEAYNWVMTDCDYVKMWDENGHFYIKCSHHDGTNLVEVKMLTEDGERYYENVDYYSGRYDERNAAKQLWTRYSRLPNYMAETYGCPRREYEKEVV